MGTWIGRDDGLRNGSVCSRSRMYLNGFTEDKVTVKLLGGDLQIEWDKEADKIYMTGPAEVSFDGEINL